MSTKLEYDVEKISNKIKHKKRNRKIIKVVILITLSMLFVINILFSIEENTHIFGIYMFQIISESMEPTFYKNDLVIVKSYPVEELKKGDIITFQQEDRVISHRIEEIFKKDENKQFITKGDNNEVQDIEPVDTEDIYGKVVSVIPKIGKMVNYIQTVRGFMNVCIFIIIIYLLINMRDIKLNNRKIKRKKYEIKKMRDNYRIEG